MGEKPFYYTERNGWFVFGSELRALLAHPEVERRLDMPGLSRYLTSGYVPDPHTILEDVFKLPPGHSLTVVSGTTRIARYWDIPFPSCRPTAPLYRTDADWAALWDSLCVSVRHRLERRHHERCVGWRRPWRGGADLT